MPQADAAPQNVLPDSICLHTEGSPVSEERSSPDTIFITPPDCGLRIYCDDTRLDGLPATTARAPLPNHCLSQQTHAMTTDLMPSSPNSPCPVSGTAVSPSGTAVRNGRCSFTLPLRAGLRLGVGWLVLGSTILAQPVQKAPLNPEFERYLATSQEPRARITAGGNHGLGLIPFPADLSHLRLQKLAAQKGARSAPLLPASYDLRALGRVTPIKDQGAYGTCWSFATFGSMESCLMPGETADFSENNLVNLAGFDWGFNDGGNAYMSMAYLTRWSGPVNETDDPYGYPGNSPAGLPVRKHVQQVQMIPGKLTPTDNDEIKQAIMNSGGVMVSFYWDETARSATDPEPFEFNEQTNTYLYTGDTSAPNNHAVTIVGWDDNFEKSKFSTVPSANGAYIVKNSWSTEWGDAGYFYVSYYDTMFAWSPMFVFLDAGPTTNFAARYSYDPLGWVNNIGTGDNNSLWGANIFTAGQTESLCSVGFYPTSLNTSYAIYIFTGVSANEPASGTLASTQSGACQYPGYCTVGLDTPVPLTAGQPYSIVLEVTSPLNDYPLVVQYAISGYSSQATSSPGQSFYSLDGSVWADLTADFDPTASCCIEGYTALAPAFTTQPTDQTVASGATASFKAEASGTAALAYRWQVFPATGAGSWTNVPAGAVYSGQATDKLTITGATASMSGNQYRCTVANIVGNANSDAAELTVNKAAQTINFPAPGNKTYGAAPFTVWATAIRIRS